jgi:hypothetical protein
MIGRSSPSWAPAGRLAGMVGSGTQANAPPPSTTITWPVL